MAKTKAQKESPPIPVPETMEEFREMARSAMALAARTTKNLEKTDGRLAKLDVRLERLAKTVAEISASSEKNLHRLDKAEKLVDELSASSEKNLHRLDKAEKVVDKISKLSGGNDHNTGRILEQEVVAKAERDGKIAWMRADEFYPQLVKRAGRRVVGEHDLVIVNGSELMVVEVKRVLRAHEVRKFAEGPLAKFRERFPKIAGDRAIYGAIAFELEENRSTDREAALQAAEDAGLLLIRAVGKTGLKILNPERKKLRAVGA